MLFYELVTDSRVNGFQNFRPKVGMVCASCTDESLETLLTTAHHKLGTDCSYISVFFFSFYPLSNQWIYFFTGKYGEICDHGTC